jgi:hypothetical protein
MALGAPFDAAISRRFRNSFNVIIHASCNPYPANAAEKEHSEKYSSGITDVVVPSAADHDEIA